MITTYNNNTILKAINIEYNLLNNNPDYANLIIAQRNILFLIKVQAKLYKEIKDKRNIILRQNNVSVGAYSLDLENCRNTLPITTINRLTNL